jgi:succinyl-diaminopimelate desuccinylase
VNVIDLFLRLLSFKSVTPDDGGSLKFIEDYLDDFEATYINKGGVKNLFLTKRFGDGKHLCFAGHVDVVPAGDGWESNPFVPKIEYGYIYARGTQDMKSGVATFVQALKDTKEFDGRLSILLTSDEEGEAKYGTQIVLEYLKEIDMLPDSCIVAEPTCEFVFGDAIKVGRRGSINGVLTIHGKQGHAAYPEKAINPVHEVAPLLSKIAGVDLDSGDDYFAPSKFVITDIRGGMEVTNVTPDKLKIMFNVRNSTKTAREDIEYFIADVFGTLDYSLELSQSAYPFVTDSDTEIVKTLSNAIKKVCCDKEPKYSTAGGTSDARFIAQYGIDVIEFGVINDRIHAPNERTSIDEVESLYEVFLETISSYGE